MESTHLTNLAKLGYEAYAASSGWKNFQGNPMPQWDELPHAIRNHWQAATKAISDNDFIRSLGTNY